MQFVNVIFCPHGQTISHTVGYWLGSEGTPTASHLMINEDHL